MLTKVLSYLLMYALVLVVEFVVVTALCSAAEKRAHLVLVKRHSTGIGVGVFVVVVMLTALTSGGMVNTVL